MKKYLATLILTMLCVSMLVGCGDTEKTPTIETKPGTNTEVTTPNTPIEETTTNVEEDAWGITLEAMNVTPTGLTIKCTQKGGPSNVTLETNGSFFLEELKSGTWTKMEYTEDNVEITWADTMQPIPQNGVVGWTIDWSLLYGTLPSGEYRIGKEIINSNEGPTIYYIEFKIN